MQTNNSQVGSLEQGVTPDSGTPSDGAPPRSRGAQPGNLNAMRHGGRARQERVGFVLAALGAKDRTAYVHARTIRKALDKLILAKQGEITKYQDARIQTLLRLELSCRTTERAMREDSDMGPADRAKLRKLICDWSIERDKILLELIGDGADSGGKNAAADVWATVGESVPEPNS